MTGFHLKDIETNAFGIALLGLTLFVTPGLLTIFMYDRELFMALDFLKLIFLSASMIAPFFAFMTVALMFKHTDDSDPRILQVCTVVSIITISSVHSILLLAAYFSGMPVRWFAGLLIAAQMAVLIFVSLRKLKNF